MGDGYYDPVKEKIFDYGGEFKRELEPDEKEWIVSKCRYAPSLEQAKKITGVSSSPPTFRVGGGPHHQEDDRAQQREDRLIQISLTLFLCMIESAQFTLSLYFWKLLYYHGPRLLSRRVRHKQPPTFLSCRHRLIPEQVVGVSLHPRSGGQQHPEPRIVLTEQRLPVFSQSPSAVRIPLSRVITPHVTEGSPMNRVSNEVIPCAM